MSAVEPDEIDAAGLRTTDRPVFPAPNSGLAFAPFARCCCWSDSRGQAIKRAGSAPETDPAPAER